MKIYLLFLEKRSLSYLFNEIIEETFDKSESETTIFTNIEHIENGTNVLSGYLLK